MTVWCIEEGVLKLSYLSLWVLLAATLLMEKAEARKGYHAHVHHHATLAISTEKANKLEARLTVDSESIYGFEHTPVKPEDKKKQKAGLDTLKSAALKLFKFEPQLGCKLESSSAKVVSQKKAKKKVYGYRRKKSRQLQGEHSEVHASYVFSCKKLLKGSKLEFGFSKVFPGIHELKVVPLEQSHKTQVIRKDGGSVEL